MAQFITEIVNSGHFLPLRLMLVVIKCHFFVKSWAKSCAFWAKKTTFSCKISGFFNGISWFFVVKKMSKICHKKYSVLVWIKYFAP